MEKIRVLRLIEYTFDSYSRAELAFTKFQVPANGSKNFGSGMIRSTILVTPLSVAPKPGIAVNVELLEKINELCDKIGRMWTDDSSQDEVKEYALELRQWLKDGR